MFLVAVISDIVSLVKHMEIVCYFGWTSNIIIKLQTEGWIDDKLKVAYEDNFQDVTDLESKMKKLQKHKAFEAECVANTDRIEKIKQVNVSLTLMKKLNR